MLSSRLAGCVGFYLVCCQLKFFLGILWSLPWHVSISTLYPAQTQSLCFNKDSNCKNCRGGSLVPVASFPGSRWVALAGTDHSRPVFCKQLAMCNKHGVCHRKGKNLENLGHQSCLYFHMVHYLVTCLVSAQVTADSGTQRQHGSTRKGVSNAMQFFHTSSQFSIAFSLH